MKKILYLIVLLLLAAAVSAKEGSITLLAVSEVDDEYVGSTADLHLEIKPGSGRVFIDTFPLTKLDTQVSTRFAKDVACSYLNINCDVYDFIYTIKAKSNIIGGPSAGAATTALTIALLADYNINETVSITGTINSGGLVGPVGGIKEKIEAAEREGIKKVLLARGSGNIELEENITIDIENYSKNLSVDMIEVTDLDDIMLHFSNIPPKPIPKNITINPEYEETMKGLAINLCGRSKEIYEKIMRFDLKNINLTEINFTSEMKSIANTTLTAEQAFNDRLFYSSASYCYSANTRYSYILNLLENSSLSTILDEIAFIREQMTELHETLDNFNLRTITDLEAYMIVKERLVEASDHLDDVEEHIYGNDSKYLKSYAFAVERLHSAFTWSEFLNQPGREFMLNNDFLEKSCTQKIAEADERIQYVKIILPDLIEDTEKQLKHAEKDQKDENYKLCLFKAAKAKAQANHLLSILYVAEDQIDGLIKNKLEVAKKTVIKSAEKDMFPILGYSYYEYSNSLKEDDQYSTLLFSEYALELGNLDMYFREANTRALEELKEEKTDKTALAFILGAVFGSGLTLVLIVTGKKKRRKRSV